MADFPSVSPDYSSTEQWRDPLLLDVSRSGAAKGRRLQPAKKRFFTLNFRVLSNTNKGTLETHYDAHRTLTFNFTWPDGGGPYVVLYANADSITWTKSSFGRWDGTIELVEA